MSVFYYLLCFLQLQPGVLRDDLLHPVGDHGNLLPPGIYMYHTNIYVLQISRYKYLQISTHIISSDGSEALGPEAHWRGHTQPRQVQENQAEGGSVVCGLYECAQSL